eukprot:COSAG02_NODE_53059_length_304_cov_0.731707_1_plen_78_part_10
MTKGDVNRRCEKCAQLISEGQRSKPAAEAKVKSPGDQRNSLCMRHVREAEDLFIPPTSLAAAAATAVAAAVTTVAALP